MTTASAIDEIVTGLIAVIDEENRLLASKTARGDELLYGRKLRLLVQLGNLDIQPGAVTEHLAEKLRTLRRLLDINARQLKLHCDSIREVWDSLAEIVRRDASDGTYRMPAHGGGRVHAL
jgi:hypothetical protein